MELGRLRPILHLLGYVFVSVSIGISFAMTSSWGAAAPPEPDHGDSWSTTSGPIVQCWAQDMRAWRATLPTDPDASTQAAKSKQILDACVQKLHLQGKVNVLGGAPPVKAEPVGVCADGRIEDDKDSIPQACEGTDPSSGATIFWLRAHLRGGNYGDTPDPMFDALRPGDGHIVILRSMLSKTTGLPDMSVDEQRTQIILPRPQGSPPNAVYALLCKRGMHSKLLTLNYSPGNPPHIDMPWSPAQLALTYDAGSDKYLLYVPRVTFLTPPWDGALPTWEQYYVWWFDAKNETIRRQLLPPGPWVSDAKLDKVLGRDLRNFSCGTDCYRHFEIKADSGNILVEISGRASAVSESVIGTYKLDKANDKWIMIKKGKPDQE
jgi:hypothetical protein